MQTREPIWFDSTKKLSLLIGWFDLKSSNFNSIVSLWRILIGWMQMIWLLKNNGNNKILSPCFLTSTVHENTWHHCPTLTTPFRTINHLFLQLRCIATVFGKQISSPQCDLGHHKAKLVEFEKSPSLFFFFSFPLLFSFFFLWGTLRVPQFLLLRALARNESRNGQRNSAGAITSPENH